MPGDDRWPLPRPTPAGHNPAMPDLAHERRLNHAPATPVCGVDEAGRGPLAGPVVAAAVILPAGSPLPDWCGAINDSKQMKAAARAALHDRIRAELPHGIGIASVAEIDTLNILGATLLAMARAVAALPVRPAAALIDGNRCPDLGGIPAHALVDGDALCLSIAAASIVAKITRDNIMGDLARRYPGYGWEKNAGYPTRAHREALARLGVTPEHRRSFAPVSQQLLLTP